MSEGRRVGTDLRIGCHLFESSSELAGGVSDRSADQRVIQFQSEPRITENVNLDSQALGGLTFIEGDSTEGPTRKTAQ